MSDSSPSSLDIKNEKSIPLKRTLCHDSSERLPYITRDSDSKSNIMHSGQLKLLCMETSFLTNWAAPDDVIVYIGGGNGNHLPTLSRMFPMVHFDVFDLFPLNALVLGETARRFSFIPRKFTIEDAEKYAPMGSRIILLSDIRPQISGSSQNSFNKDEEKTQKVKRNAILDNFDDMNLQRAWVETMKPRQAFLRFLVPYEGCKSVEYLSGDMYMQPFTKRSSTEVRLHVAPPRMTTNDGMRYMTSIYDCSKQEECMFYHNSVTRREHLEANSCFSAAKKQHLSMDKSSTEVASNEIGEDITKNNRRMQSYDHRLAHTIIKEWIDRAKADKDINCGLEGIELDKHLHGIVRAMDMLYGKLLGLKFSDEFGFIFKDHQKEEGSDSLTTTLNIHQNKKNHNNNSKKKIGNSCPL